MFRKRRVATPGYGHAPYNPIHGDQASLRQDGTAPFCAMMQVAAEDTYDDYVICRGFDTRILKFIDYAEGDDDKPGISVAKPFGKRTSGTYQVGEIYPALLPTQGNANSEDLSRIVYTPPSPKAVDWRVGQNPGVVGEGALDGGQPSDLDDAIAILYDHNGKAINYLLIDGGQSVSIRYMVLLEDFEDSGPAKAKWVRRDDNASRGRFDVYCHDDILDGAQAGYKCLYGFVDNEWVAIVAECIVECVSVGVLTVGIAPDGTVGVAYTHTVSGTGLTAGTFAATELPFGLSINATTGEISGTPTTAGSYTAYITADAPRTGGGTCTRTKSLDITIEPAAE